MHSFFRADQLETGISKDFLLERRTESAGKATVSVPCGYLDLFAAADRFTSHAEKMLIERENTLLSVKLKVNRRKFKYREALGSRCCWRESAP